MTPEKLEVDDFDRVSAPDRADDSWNGIGVPAAVQRRSGVVQIDPVERRGETIRIAFAANFSVGDDVETRILLRLDRHDGGVFLRLRQVGCRHAP
jgi:hypothetical protein